MVANTADFYRLVLFGAIADTAQISGNGLAPARSRTDVIYAFACLCQAAHLIVRADSDFIFQSAQLRPATGLAEVSLFGMPCNRINPSGIAYSDEVGQHRTAPICRIANVGGAAFRRINNSLSLRNAYSQFLFQTRQQIPAVAAADIVHITVLDRRIGTRTIAFAHMVRHHGFAPALIATDIFKRIEFGRVRFKRSLQLAAAIAQLFFEIGKAAPGAIFAGVAFSIKQHGRRIIGGSAAFARIRDICDLPGVVLTDVQGVVDRYRRIFNNVAAAFAKVVCPTISEAAVVGLFIYDIKRSHVFFANGIANGQVIFRFNYISIGHAAQLVIAMHLLFFECRRHRLRGKHGNAVLSQVLAGFPKTLAVQRARLVGTGTTVTQLQSASRSRVIGAVMAKPLPVSFQGNIEPRRAGRIGRRRFKKFAVGIAVFAIVVIANAGGSPTAIVHVLGHPDVHANLDGFNGFTGTGILDSAPNHRVVRGLDIYVMRIGPVLRIPTIFRAGVIRTGFFGARIFGARTGITTARCQTQARQCTTKNKLDSRVHSLLL